MSKLDDIIIPLETILFHEDDYTTLKERRKFYKIELKKEIKALMLELIGENLEDFDEGDSEWQDGINTLKVELRQKVDKL